MPDKRNLVERIDQLVLFFMLLFLASLTNSIFINQLGYYGALLLLLARYFITKNNPFERTGLESALIWFIAAEIFSLIFSLNHSQSLLFATRRFLLIPLIFVTVAAIPDLKRAKIYFYTYISAAIITALVYLIFSYQYFISNLYSITQSGPSLFQYPITSSEILSITSVFLFAFLINEKNDWKYKLLVAAAFFITIVALVATYKRTGWLATGFGIFLIILIKKEWKFLVPLFILVAALFIYEKNISRVDIFINENNHLIQENSFKTEGRAYDLTASGSYCYISDYEDGILKYKGDKKLQTIEVPSPIVSLKKWKNYLLGYFIDTRFISYQSDSSGNLTQVAECLPPGFTIGYALSGNYLYTIDSDSGLTIFENPAKLSAVYRDTKFSKFNKVFVDSDLVLFYSPDSGACVFNLQNGIPGKELYRFKPHYPVSSVFYFQRILYFSNEQGIKSYKVEEDSVSYLTDDNKPNTIFLWREAGKNLIAADQNGKIFLRDSNSVSFKLIKSAGYIPSAITLSGDTLITSFVKRSRLLSIWDPYLPSNYVRLSLWKAGWKIFLDHPVFGVGDIDLAFLYKQYKSKYEKEIQGHMHNNFVHILVTLGLFGLFAFCFLLYKMFRIDFSIYREIKNISFISSYALGTIAALSTVIIAGLTELNFFDHEIMTLLWFTFGLNVALYKRYKSKNI
jgi:O-antigen ligase